VAAVLLLRLVEAGSAHELVVESLHLLSSLGSIDYVDLVFLVTMALADQGTARGGRR
jgi:hypothetical protein